MELLLGIKALKYIKGLVLYCLQREKATMILLPKYLKRSPCLFHRAQ
jgi:hypothetical protein